MERFTPSGKNTPRIALVGRPNVGKSTLFNRLVGRRTALVDDRPGMTRDYKEGVATHGKTKVTLFDTAGLEEVYDDSINARMRDQTLKALEKADAILFMIDGRAGVTPMDVFFADIVRRSKKDIILVVNKAEGRLAEQRSYDAYRLGLGEPVPVSAEHGEGITDLWQHMLEALYLNDDFFEAPEEDAPIDEDEKPVFDVAFVGRPNVGKSTLLNALIGEDRVLTSPEAGTTRDSIAVEFKRGDKTLRLIDTAGLRKRRTINDSLEKLSVVDTFKSIQYAEIVVLVIDGTMGLENQDLTIARKVLEEGRALILAVNKWDLVKDKDKTMKTLHETIDDSLAQARGISIVNLAAIKQKNFDELLDTCFKVYEMWNKRVSTGELNRWLEVTLSENPPPNVSGRRLKIKYITQVKSRPPTFALFMTRSEQLPEFYVRYLKAGMRKHLGLVGVPLRIVSRSPKNPYDDKK